MTLILMILGLYSIADGVWEKAVQDVRPSKRSSVDMVYDPDNHVVVLFGGFSDSRQSLGDTWILDCASLTWRQAETNSGSRQLREDDRSPFIPGFPVWVILLAVSVFLLKHGKTVSLVSST